MIANLMSLLTLGTSAIVGSSEAPCADDGILCRGPIHGEAHQPHCSSHLHNILLSEPTCTILNFLDGTLRFAESVALLHICLRVSFYKQYMWVVLLKAEHANAMAFAQVIILSLMSTRPMAKLCLLCA